MEAPQSTFVRVMKHKAVQISRDSNNSRVNSPQRFEYSKPSADPSLPSLTVQPAGSFALTVSHPPLRNTKDLPATLDQTFTTSSDSHKISNKMSVSFILNDEPSKPQSPNPPPAQISYPTGSNARIEIIARHGLDAIPTNTLVDLAKYYTIAEIMFNANIWQKSKNKPTFTANKISNKLRKAIEKVARHTNVKPEIVRAQVDRAKKANGTYSRQTQMANHACVKARAANKAARASRGSHVADPNQSAGPSCSQESG